jgi:hypothetical protein
LVPALEATIHDKPLSKFAFNLILRPYTLVLCTDMAPPAVGRTCGNCPSGYEGDGTTCADIDECADGANGGCDAATVCVNVPGAVQCGPCPDWALGRVAQVETCSNIDTHAESAWC